MLKDELKEMKDNAIRKSKLNTKSKNPESIIEEVQSRN